MLEGGYKRQCGNCGAEHFPRTDPVVIMLATYGEQCLLGRQRGWPGGMLSALAGFMEPGETIEEAVARELQEEAGLEINHVTYLGTQPWPFPGSLMIGCLAEASSLEVSVDEVELEEARWVSRDDVISSMRGDGPLGVPPQMAIAFQLMQAFAEGVALNCLATPRVPVPPYRRPKYPFRNNKAQLFQSLAHRLAFRMAFNIGVKLRRQKTVGLIALKLGHIDLIGGKAAQRFIKRGGHIAHTENETGHDIFFIRLGIIGAGRHDEKARRIAGTVFNIFAQHIKAVNFGCQF